jgi:hypothetical protein
MIRVRPRARRAFVAASLALLAASSAAASLAACSDDASVNPVPVEAGSGSDATTTADVGNGEGAAPSEAGAREGGAVDAGCAVDAGPLDDAEVALGFALVQQLKCQQCHGQTLSGNRNGVPAPGGGTAYPPNLTRDPDTGLGCWSTADITNAILNGVDDQGRALCPPMPHFGARGLDAGAVVSIVQFLRSLPSVSNQVSETTCPVLDAGDDAADAASDATDDAADAGDANDAATDASSDADADH